MSSDRDLIKDLRGPNTLIFLLLSIFTLDIYAGHYMMRKTRVINQHLEAKYQLPTSFPRTLLVLTYLLALIYVASGFVDFEGWPRIATLCGVANLVWVGLVVFWALMVRTRMNYLLRAGRKDKKHISLIGIAFFSILYLNFKINRIGRLIEREIVKSN